MAILAITQMSYVGSLTPFYKEEMETEKLLDLPKVSAGALGHLKPETRVQNILTSTLFTAAPPLDPDFFKCRNDVVLLLLIFLTSMSAPKFNLVPPCISSSKSRFTLT